MVNIILMFGTILLAYLIILLIMPSFESVKNKTTHETEGSYNIACHVGSLLLSLTINFLVWGIILW